MFCIFVCFFVSDSSQLPVELPPEAAGGLTLAASVSILGSLSGVSAGRLDVCLFWGSHSVEDPYSDSCYVGGLTPHAPGRRAVVAGVCTLAKIAKRKNGLGTRSGVL